MKKLTLLIGIVLLLCGTFIQAQELKVEPRGVSPFDVVRDSVEQYFDMRYTGLENVGVGTKVFLKGEFMDSTLNSPTWTFLSKPGGSGAVFGATKDVDASTQLVTFVADVNGTYVVEFSDGTFADTITINAALYLGYEGGAVACGVCHSDKVTEWEGTGHSDMLVRGLEGTLSSHYGESCIECHTVGYDPNADNDGFDDFSFVFPDSLYPGQYQNMVNMYPDAMERANIQCESCHGPGGNHIGQISDSKMVSSLQNGPCAYCHDDGHYHVFPYQWDVSAHASGNTLYSGPTRTSCTPCHNGQGFIQFADGESQETTEEIPITCATCHDPHDATLEHQLRLNTATLSNDFEITNAGNGGLCINCHKTRRNAVDYVTHYLDNLSSHYGPHHGPQGDVLVAQNVYTWGETLPTSPHFAATEDACVDCHMAEVEHPVGGIPQVGGHSFAMVDPQGIDNVEACEPCHGNFGEEFADKKYYVNGDADLDKDGTAEGLPYEIEGLLEQLSTLLPPVGSTDINVIDSSWTLNQAAGYYNYEVALEDRSGGIHNPAFTVALLYLSIEKNGGVVSVDDLYGNGPTDFSLAQNYPNPFNPATIIEYSVPMQTNVKVAVYDALGRELEVLFNGVQTPGTHEVTWNAANYSSGIYFYKMEGDNFVQVRKMVLVK